MESHAALSSPTNRVISLYSDHRRNGILTVYIMMVFLASVWHGHLSITYVDMMPQSNPASRKIIKPGAELNLAGRWTTNFSVRTGWPHYCYLCLVHDSTVTRWASGRCIFSLHYSPYIFQLVHQPINATGKNGTAVPVT